jgi:H+/Cl- antiporter ClcA
MEFKLRHRLKPYGVSIVIGLTSGLLGGALLHSLQWATGIRFAYPQLIWGLPLVGLLIPHLYKTFGFGSERGMQLLLEEIHTAKQLAPWTMAPLIFLTTLLTHLTGGSAGREGTALQMTASFADRIANFFKVALHQRRWVLMAGLSGGFSAALGAPWAGMIFGLEVVTVGHLDRKALIECFIASFVSWFIALGINTPHFVGHSILPPDFSITLFFHLLLLAIFLGLISRCHVEGIRWVEKILRPLPPSWRTGLGGATLLGLFLAFPLTAYQGLGLLSISSAFTEPIGVEMPFLKLGLTILTLATGFKGGEFIPLVFIGSTAGSALANIWQEPIAFFASLGFVALFGAAAKTPWTCSVLAIEYFGWPIAPYALLVTLAAYATAGPFGIYPGQRILQRKHRFSRARDQN